MSYSPGSFLVGEIRIFAGPTAPTGWLLCYGQTVSRATYEALFAAIGTTYGAGDGSTTFLLPDIRGRAIVGKDNMGGVAANRVTAPNSGITGTTLGSTGGAETMMQHTHSASGLTISAHSITDNGHAHTNNVNSWSLNANVAAGAGAGGFAAGGSPAQTISAATGISIAAHTLGGSVGPTGTGATQGNMPPSIIMNYIIKY